MTERDIDKLPYTADELRVVDYIRKITHDVVGAGDDPIGFIMASHSELARQRHELQGQVASYQCSATNAAKTIVEIMASNAKYDDLIAWMPAGDVQYVREPDGAWGVAIFPPGAVARIATVATGMDKGAAAWFAAQLRVARASTPP